MPSLIWFAARWVLLGSLGWVTCLVLFALFRPAIGLAAMALWGTAYVADLRLLTRGASQPGAADARKRCHRIRRSVH